VEVTCHLPVLHKRKRDIALQVVLAISWLLLDT
jgi:hypothetical protein